MAEFNVKALKAGDRVGVKRGNYGFGDIRTVARVTASGQVVLDNGRRYTPEGREIGASGYDRPRLVSVEHGEELAAQSSLYAAMGDLARLVSRTVAEHGGTSGPMYATRFTTAERAELLALIDQCSEPG